MRHQESRGDEVAAQTGLSAGDAAFSPSVEVAHEDAIPAVTGESDEAYGFTNGPGRSNCCYSPLQPARAAMPLKQKHLEGLVSLACGVGAATIGAAAVAGAVPGLGPAIALLSSLWNPLTEGGKKLVESVSESTLQRGWRAVHAQLAGAPGHEFPSNHDLLRAVRESWLLGLAYCLKKCRADVQTHPDEFDAANVMAQLNAAMRWIDSEVAACKRSDYFAMADREDTADQTLPFRRELDILGQRVADVRNPQEAGLLYGHLFEVATLAAIAELADRLPSPLLQPLRDWILGRNERHYSGGTDYQPGWAAASAAWFAHMVKHDDVLRTVVFATQLDAMRLGQNDLLAGMDRLLGEVRDLRQALSELDSSMSAIAENSGRGFTKDQRVETLLSLAAARSVEALTQNLRSAFPPGVLWSQTATQVRQRQAQLQANFVGRSVEIQALDGFVDGNSRGLMVVSAPAGYGKSALVAHWIDRRSRNGDRVVRHFISNRHDQTTDPAQVLGHLLVQLADRPAAAPDSLETAGALQQRLHHRCSSGPPAGTRWIVVIDGLDEARALVPAFIEDDLASGVFVVVTCRATAGSWPAPLSAWQARSTMVPSIRLDVGTMDCASIDDWLAHRLPSLLRASDREQVSRQLLRSSDGIALYLHYLIDDLVSRLDAEGLTQTRATTLTVPALPPSFAAYVNDQFSRLSQDGAAAWTPAHQRLLAMLCVALGPLLQDDLDDLMEGQLALDSLDHRLARWLCVEGEAPRLVFSLAHPRLAEVLFARLPRRVSSNAEQDLVAWAQRAWRAASGGAGAPYALDWLPAHLVRLDPAAAAALLRNTGFLAARLADQKQASARLARSLDEWHALDQALRDDEDGRDWAAFWAENERAIRLAVSEPAANGRPARRIVTDCLLDAGIGAGSVRSRALFSHPRPRSALIRNVTETFARASAVSGAMRVGDRIVSWGGSGLRFWSLSGGAMPGGGTFQGSDLSQPTIVGPFLYTADRPGKVRRWTLEGEELAFECDADQFRGVIAVDEHLVFWAGTAIWLSDAQGRTRVGHVLAHYLQVEGVLRVEGLLVSWGAEGELHFWSLDLSRVKGGDDFAHGSRTIGGVIRARDRLVSWGDDGAIRHWSLTGSPLKGGDQQAHNGKVGGVACLADGLISWGDDGAVRFWSVTGEPIWTGHESAHLHAVGGVGSNGDQIVSWGKSDGAIRLWSLDGQALPGGDLVAHRGGVRGVVSCESGWASWGEDGLARFWTHEGLPSDRQCAPLPVGRIAGALPLGQNLLTWGERGLCFWSVGQTFDEEPEVMVGIAEGPLRFATWGNRPGFRLWSPDGMPLGRFGAYLGQVDGALVTATRVITWYASGAIRCWSFDGESMEGGHAMAHRHGVRGLKKHGDRLMSWSFQLRFWSMDGLAMGDAVDASFPTFFTDVQTFGKGLIGLGNQPRFLSADGALLDSGPLEDERALVTSIAVDETVVTGGKRGDVRFWSATGRPIAGGAPDAHRTEVSGLLRQADRIFSWDRYGHVRSWSLAGTALGGFQAHDGWGVSVISLGDRLLSWISGEMALWSPSGAAIDSVDLRRHGAGVRRVQAIGSSIVSLHDPGILKVWDRNGRFRGSLVPPGGVHVVAANGTGDRLLVGGTALWIYPLTDGLPWNVRE